MSAVHLRYTFKLKPNLKLSDGIPVVDADMVYSTIRAHSKTYALTMVTGYRETSQGLRP